MNKDNMGVEWLRKMGEFMADELPDHGELSLDYTTSNEDGESAPLVDKVHASALQDMWDMMRDEVEDQAAQDDGWDFL